MANDNFEFFQLRCFVAVAEELNFRRAAARLNMTQPPLSRQIKLLEHAIDEVLFERTTRAVRLTSAGESFLASATEILSRANHAVLRARQASRGEVGDVALGFVPSAGIAFVPRMVAAVRDALPEVQVQPTEMMSYEINEALISGRLDLGLTRTARRYSEIESLRVVNEPFLLALPADHPLAGVSAPQLRHLDGEDFIAYSDDRGGFLRDLHSAIFASEGITPNAVLEVSQTLSVLALVNQGLGVALVPRSSREVQMKNLVYREVETPPSYRSTLYLCAGPKHRDRSLFRRLRTVIVEALAPFA